MNTQFGLFCLTLQIEEPFFFNAGRSGSVNSINDGTLTRQVPEAGIGKDDYIVDYSCDSPCLTYEMSRKDMGANDAKGLTHTSQPLPESVEVTGFPVIHLWISSTAVDGDFYAFLEEIDPDGHSRYVAMGQLRASHRATHKPNFDNLGLPWHRSLRQDVSDLIPGQPTELVFSLQPTSNIFNVGQRLRVTITCAERDVTTPHELTPPPTVTLYRNKEYTSYITLPVIPWKKG